MLDNILLSKVGMSLTKKVFSEVQTYTPDEFGIDAKKKKNKDGEEESEEESDFHDRTERVYQEKKDLIKQ